MNIVIDGGGGEGAVIEELKLPLTRIHNGGTLSEAQDAPSIVPLSLRIDRSDFEIRLDHLLYIGRSPKNEFALPADETVSWRHCVVYPDLGHVRLVDLSGRGVLLDGNRVYQSALRPGMVLTVGRTTMRVVGQGLRFVPSAKKPMLGDSAAMRHLRSEIDLFAPLGRPVHLFGESGTGKELAANAVHHASRRAVGPFVAHNCASLTEQLADNELFGHERGAFTSAQGQHCGLFEQANGGTLFLDEIADLSLPVQAKLLRAIQEGTIRPLGARSDRPVDVRIVTATNRDLRALVAEGKFREDLFYRLRADCRIVVPPLRERREDIPLLAVHFLDAALADMKVADKALASEAIGALQAYHWPGNVRELQGMIEYAAVRCPHPRIEVIYFWPASTRRFLDGKAIRWQGSPAEVARDVIAAALRETRGNVQRAAPIVGISWRTLYRKMQEFGIDADSFRRP